MSEIVEAHLFHAVPLDEGRKLRSQVIGPHPLAKLVHEYKAVVFVVVAVAADLLVQLLRRLDLRKVFLESSHQRQGSHNRMRITAVSVIPQSFALRFNSLASCGESQNCFLILRCIMFFLSLRGIRVRPNEIHRFTTFGSINGLLAKITQPKTAVLYYLL